MIEEGKIGSDYRVDLKIKSNLQKSAETDHLADTVDYVHLNKIVTEEMAIRAHLLEHVAKRINNRVLAEILIVEKTTVSVSKINPPIGGDVESVTIKMSQIRR